MMLMSKLKLLIFILHSLSAAPRSDREDSSSQESNTKNKNTQDFSTFLLNSSRGGDQVRSVEELFNQYYGNVGTERISSSPLVNHFYKKEGGSRVKSYKFRTGEDGTQKIVSGDDFEENKNQDQEMSKSKTALEPIKNRKSASQKRRKFRKHRLRKQKNKPSTNKNKNLEQLKTVFKRSGLKQLDTMTMTPIDNKDVEHVDLAMEVMNNVVTELECRDASAKMKEKFKDLVKDLKRANSISRQMGTEFRRQNRNVMKKLQDISIGLDVNF